MLKKGISLITIIFITVLPVSVLAHPGHGATDGHSLWHYLTEPFHVFSMVAALILLSVAIYWYTVKKRKKAKINA